MDAGIIVMDKPADFTSFDVVAKLRGILHIKKIGHTGTLDPIATGVLVVCVGRATKLVSKLTAEEKIYEAGVLFGEKYDTGDITGKLIKNDSVVITEDDFRTACQQFVGDIDQIPPMYSAKKVNGKKLYEYAREGIEVEREPERIHIYSIELLGFDFPHAQIRVHCSKGTYIRTLIEDISEAAGTVGTMESLRRTKNGDFSIEDAVTFEQLEAADDPWSLVKPVEV
ncbi:MAG: tRNA pseudouridine(55) synthase TruB [Lachnospiraceae bacterium]|jgi:tRNA pseudouridine55 synthase|nr:tRNA pseudouridine(55) synthase TruB [Lachnospiraceae bacterium]